MACYDFFHLGRIRFTHASVFNTTQSPTSCDPKVMLVPNTARLTVADARGGALR